MTTKIMQVFYGTDLLPYKDKERQVHFPIVGGAFLGASQTTEIRFYIEKIGSVEDTWVANSKLPNGKLGNEILSKGYDNEIGESYVSLSLKSFYTQAKGDLYISLNGFLGGVEIVEEGGVPRVVGIPTIQATGCIKLAINYATPLIAGDEVEQITLESLLAELGLKQDRYSANNYRAYNSFLEAVYDLGNLVENQMFSYIEIIDNKPYERLAYKHNGDIVPLVVYNAYADENGNRITETYETKENARFSFQFLQSQINGLESSKVNKPIGAVPFNKYLGTDEYGTMVWKEGGTGGSEIDDTTTATDKTWSSAKIKQEQDILRAIAEGKTKSVVISYNEVAPTEQTFSQRNYYRVDGTKIETFNDYSSIVYGLLNNRYFKSVEEELHSPIAWGYLLFRKGNDRIVVLDTEFRTYVNANDLIIVAERYIDGDTSTYCPDRWFDGVNTLYALETAKIDLDNYYTKGEVEAIRQALQEEIDDIVYNVETELTQEISGIVVPKVSSYEVIDIHNKLLNGSVAKINTYLVINSSENDNGDIIINVAFDENTIVKYVALNGQSGEEDFAKIEVIQSMHYKQLIYDGTNIKDGETILTFNDIKALIQNQTDYVYVKDTYHLAVLTFQAYENDAIWFNTRYKISDENHFVRLIINEDNDIKFDDDIGVMLDSNGKVPSSVLPNATDGISGAMKIGSGLKSFGFGYVGVDYPGNEADAKNFFGARNSSKIVNGFTIDTATKLALSAPIADYTHADGSAYPSTGTRENTYKNAWTEEEKARARERLGISDSYSTHIVNVATSTAVGTYRYQFQLPAPITTTFTLLSQVANYLYSKKANLRINVSGTYTENGTVYLIVGMEAISTSQVRIEMYKASDGTYKAIDTGAVDVIDTIIG